MHTPERGSDLGSASLSGQQQLSDSSPAGSSGGTLTGGGGGDASGNNGAHRLIAVESLESASELALMVGYKNSDELARRGGIEGIIAGLNSHPLRGIANDTVPARIRRWGLNELPPVEQESFWGFVKEALDDRTMKILIGAAVVSLVLGLTTPDPRTGHVDPASGWMEGTAILLSVVIVSLVAAVNNMQKQQQFMAVSNKETVKPVIVVREGTVLQLPHRDIVVGDLVQVACGDSLPFDALLVEGTGYSCNEASMTGEVDDVPKSAGVDPFLVSGTHIVDGIDGLAVVVAVGEKSFAGSIAMSTREEKSSTPLQEQLEEMADVIGRFGLAAAVLTFVVLVAKEIVMALLVHSDSFYVMRVFENLTTAVAIVVVAVPEGLPLSVTLSLAYSMKRMLNDNNLVRHLAACETMGGATCICTDKTGTLTSNDMEVSSVFTLGAHHRVEVSMSGTGKMFLEAPGKKYTLSSSVDWSNRAQNVVLRKVADCIALNYGALNAKSNKTAAALLDLCDAIKQGSRYDALEESERVDRSAIQRFAFTSIRKRGSVVVAHSHDTQQQQQGASASSSSANFSTTGALHNSNNSSQTVFLSSLPGPSIPGSSGVILTHYVVGAAELILQKCTAYVTPDGRRTALTSDAKAEIEGVIGNYAGRGWRTLCLGLSERRANWTEPPKIAPDDPLTFLAVVGIAEPLRPAVPDAIRSCSNAGVRTVMVTGDNLRTAMYIAKMCNILPRDEDETTTTTAADFVSAGGEKAAAATPIERNHSRSSSNNRGGANDDLSSNSSFVAGAVSQTAFRAAVASNKVMDGNSFRERSDSDIIQNVLPYLAVLARASPLDKKRLVTLLRNSDPDAVVCVTGDGTNDAPALKAADVGFAMNSGSDIAKQSSDIVLMDDNFAGVVKAIVWGRNVRDNIKKFLQFQLTVNGVACLVAFLGALVNTQNLSPLKPVQLLWLNLIMDTFAALALATELPHDATLLSRAPEPRTASMISPAMRTNILTQGLFQLTVQLVLLLVGEHLFAGMVEFSDVHITVVFNTFVLMQVFNFFNARKLSPCEAVSTTSVVTANGAPSSISNGGGVGDDTSCAVTPQVVVGSTTTTTTTTTVISNIVSSPRNNIGGGSSFGNSNGNKNNNNMIGQLIEEFSAVLQHSQVMLYIIATIIVSQVFIVQCGGKFMSTVPLDREQWLVCVFVASFSLPVGYASRRMGARSAMAGYATQGFSVMLSSLTKVENLCLRLRSSITPSIPKEKHAV